MKKVNMSENCAALIDKVFWTGFEYVFITQPIQLAKIVEKRLCSGLQLPILHPTHFHRKRKLAGCVLIKWRFDDQRKN